MVSLIATEVPRFLYQTNTRHSRLTALGAGLLQPVVQIWLRCSSFRTCQRQLLALAGKLPRVPTSGTGRETAEELAQITDFANQRYALRKSACLVRSLVLQYLLARHGLESVIRLGVRSVNDRREFHAWVEYQGQALNEDVPPSETFALLDWTRALETQAHATDTLYYDENCVICRRSALRLERQQRGGLEIIAVGCAEADNDLPGKAALQRSLHLRTGAGQWLTGLDAVLQAWSHTRWHWLLSPLRWPLLHSLAEVAFDGWELWHYRRLYGCPSCGDAGD